MSSTDPRPPPSDASNHGGSYTPGHRTYHVPDYSTSNERTSLVPSNRPSKPTSFIWILVATATISAFIGGLFITLPVNDPVVWRRDRMSYLKDRELWQGQKRAYTGEELVRNEQRSAFNGEKLSWEKERVVFDQERTMMDKERADMAAQRIVFDGDSAKWASERGALKQDMDRWGREHTWRDEQYASAPSGAYWQEPIPDPHCYGYGKRKHIAKIMAVPNGWNLVDACKALPIHIHEQTVLTPDMCIDTGRDGTYGHYVIDFNETACEEAMFTDFRDLGCVAKGSQLRRAEAQIRNIDPGEDWKAICRTTPATVSGIHYNGPSHCEERSGNKVATWDIEDLNC